MKDIYEGSKRHNLLNGKCLEAFLEWYRDVYSIEHDINDNGWSVNYMPFEMAYGVYVAFSLYLSKPTEPYNILRYTLFKYDNYPSDITFLDCQKIAVKRLNETYNEEIN